MAGDDDDRYGSDLRESPPPRSRSYHRSPDEDGRELSPVDTREGRENGDRYREVRDETDALTSFLLFHSSLRVCRTGIAPALVEQVLMTVCRIECCYGA